METTTKTSERQETQEELLEKAKALPGVKEAAEVYGRVTRHIGDQPAVTTKVTSYATGGNAS